ncbi:tyrosine-type recombinase/integrase [Spirochaeta dissipatitropha]
MAVYNRMYGSTEPEFHLIKKKNKAGKPIYHVGFLSDQVGRNGKPTYKMMKSTGVGSRTAAEKIARQMIAEGLIFTSKDDLRNYLMNFWDYENSEYVKGLNAEGRTISKQYCTDSIGVLERYVLPYFETRNLTKLSDLNRQNILQWRNYFFEHKTIPEYTAGENAAENKIVSHRTINRARQALFVALQYAAETGLLPVNPGQGIRKVKETTSEQKIFEVSELNQIFNDPEHWGDIRKYAAAMIAATTGARLGEVTGLQIKNLNFQDNTVDILNSWHQTEGLKPCKWNSFRQNVVLPEMTVRVIKELLDNHPWADNPTAYLIYSASGSHRPLDGRAITKALQKRVRQLNLQSGRNFHSLRHTFVSYIRGLLPESKVIRLVGHSNTKMEAHYTHVTESDIEQLRRSVSGLISG